MTARASSTSVQLQEIRRLRDERSGAEDRFRQELVRVMRDRGTLTVDQIAEAAGLTRGRLYQIVGEASRDTAEGAQ